LSRRNLPPLQVGTTYRVSDFELLEFSAGSLWKTVTGEDTAILRLHLANATILEMPISDDALRHHMRLLVSAYPTEAIEFLKTQPWCPVGLKEEK